MNLLLENTITCPECGHQTKETMHPRFSQAVHVCPQCGATVTPKEGDCCVFCSYGEVPCPPVQEKRSGNCCGACGG